MTSPAPLAASVSNQVDTETTRSFTELACENEPPARRRRGSRRARGQRPEKRHMADYDPRPRFKTLDARLAISSGRTAVHRFEMANAEHRKAFLTLLICAPR